jgi:hypothetical protein
MSPFYLYNWKMKVNLNEIELSIILEQVGMGMRIV